MSEFFEEMSEASEVKSTIVEKYFNAWTRIIVPRARTGRVAYIDLFCGPGRYNNGDKSTPIKILELCIERQDLAQAVVPIFNDANSDYVRALKEEIEKLTGKGKLKFQPIVMNSAVGKDLAQLLSSQDLIPSLSFVDPWGYKGPYAATYSSLVERLGLYNLFL